MKLETNTSPAVRCRRSWAPLAVAVAALLLQVSAVSADMTVVSKVTLGKGRSSQSTQYVSGSKVRTSDGENDTILDYETGAMIFVDHNKKRYWQTSLEELRASFAELEKMLEANPMMERMFGAATEPKVEALSEERQIAGYACKKYRVTMGDKLVFVVWAAPDLEVPTAYYDARKAFHVSMGPFGSRFEKMFEALKKVEGFPLGMDMESKVMGIDLQTSSEAVSVDLGSVPASAFEIPAGYKERKPPK